MALSCPLPIKLILSLLLLAALSKWPRTTPPSPRFLPQPLPISLLPLFLSQPLTASITLSLYPRIKHCPNCILPPVYLFWHPDIVRLDSYWCISFCSIPLSHHAAFCLRHGSLSRHLFGLRCCPDVYRLQPIEEV